MSKARVFADSLRAAYGICPASFLATGPDHLWAVKASVTNDGHCVIEKNGYTISPKDAVALARWILATFGDEQPSASASTHWLDVTYE